MGDHRCDTLGGHQFELFCQGQGERTTLPKHQEGIAEVRGGAKRNGSNRVECLEMNIDASTSHDVSWTKYIVTFKVGLSPKVRFQLCLSTVSPSSSGHGKDPLTQGK